LVHTEEARPYSTPLDHAIASSSSEKLCTVMTGPKISCWIVRSSCRSPPTTVGASRNLVALAFAADGDRGVRRDVREEGQR
jgi:hypothetical protein